VTSATAELALARSVSAQASLRQLELLVRKRVDGLLHGDHQGLIPGSGTDTADGRAYEPGDDVRRIDWNLSARSTSTQVRDTIAERELDTWLVVDGTASLDFGTADHEKRDVAMAAVATFGFLAVGGGNRVGAVVFDDRGIEVVPPRAGVVAVRGLLLKLLRRERAGEGRPSLADALDRAGRLAQRRGLVVAVSDLLAGDTGWDRPMRALASRHDTVVVEVGDPRERDLPPVGFLTLVDPETGRLRDVQTSDARLRARFRAAAEADRDEVRRRVRACGASNLVLSTDRDWTLDVVRFVQARRRRR
jgi:uncharacterized protein (DUF58 family)